MEPHESDSGSPFDEVEPLNFHDEESVVHTVLEDFYAVGTLVDELTVGFHMEAHRPCRPLNESDGGCPKRGGHALVERCIAAVLLR